MIYALWLSSHMISTVGAQLRVRVQVQIKACTAHFCTRRWHRRMLVAQVAGGCIANILELRSFECLIFCLECSVSLTKGIVVLFGLVEHLLEVFYPLVLAFAISSLGSTVLGSSTLFVADGLVLSLQLWFVHTDMTGKIQDLSHTDRTDGGAFLYRFSRFLLGFCSCGGCCDDSSSDSRP